MARTPRPPSSDPAAAHGVLHLVADRAEVGPTHAHIVGIETATDGEPRRWSLVDFVEAFRRGERFHLAAGEEMVVEPEVCSLCSKVTIATHRVRAPT